MGVELGYELSLWLFVQAGAGRDRGEVAAVLARKGLDPERIEPLCDLAYGNLPALRLELEQAEQRMIAAQEDPDHAGTAAPRLRFEPFRAMATLPKQINAWDAPHGRVEVLARLVQPHVVILGNLLAQAECEALMAFSRDRLQRAGVVDSERGGSYVDPRRTSELVMLGRAETPLIAAIEARIEVVTGIPACHGEGFQVMRYGAGGEYQPHFDYFHADRPGERRLLDNGGQRTASLVIYLNPCDSGGETVFPRVGLEVVPRRGGAVYFAYADAQSGCDLLSLHGGAPVGGTGEKWIATKWLREREFC